MENLKLENAKKTLEIVKDMINAHTGESWELKESFNNYLTLFCGNLEIGLYPNSKNPYFSYNMPDNFKDISRFRDEYIDVNCSLNKNPKLIFNALIKNLQEIKDVHKKLSERFDRVNLENTQINDYLKKVTGKNLIILKEKSLKTDAELRLNGGGYLLDRDCYFYKDNVRLCIGGMSAALAEKILKVLNEYDEV
jgi:hypothetical protein